MPSCILLMELGPIVILVHFRELPFTKPISLVGIIREGEQYKWLKRDLAKVDRQVTPWLVATWHPPWYSTYTAHCREAECMRVAMEELLYKHSVDKVFNGHVIGDGGNREKMAITHADEDGNCPKPSSTPDKILGGFCAFNFTSGQRLVNFAGTGSLIIVLIAKAALVMVF
ncbi:hypothetical protein Patl1_25825 [Pistacia atlantica]|uniref:Uncharacterized protein n=1 Tax=Pistacia atlantica TaxID=434234 RepID=A0ACC1AZW5_9ROSI|nr:hypothetical protein Patl1_25825 [Pistacia atlantica]